MQWQFGSFRLDMENACLWQDAQRLVLRPKTFDLLAHLVQHAGDLVSRETLLDAVWPDTTVADGVLATSITELRKALGETAREPQFIATVHRRGYRFIAPVTVSDQPQFFPLSPSPHDTSGHSSPAAAHPGLVDREMELERLHQGLATARRGQRHVLMVTGEAGIGKTTLIDTFVAQLAERESVAMGRGQCIDQYGASEPYLPLLEAFGNLAQTAHRAPIKEVLRQHAPSWVVQLPVLLSPDESEPLQQGALGVTQERMLRELAEAVEILTTSHPLVLVLEDLHWSDVSTVNWLAYIARRRAVARLLILGTYRPVDAVVRDHPVRSMTQELRLHGLCEELALDYVSEAGVVAYVTQRFGVMSHLDMIADTLYQRTRGNPLFMVTMADAMVRQGVLQQTATGWECVEDVSTRMVEVPETLQQFIEQQFRSLAPEERAVFEVASVAGIEFSAAAIAAGIQEGLEEVEERCDALARQHRFIHACGTAAWCDGTVTTRYAFIHALYQECVYERLSAERRARWHRQIGARLEAGYGDQALVIATELAEHFVRGRDARRAVQYLQYAGEGALRRNAHQEAMTQLTKGLEILETLPDTAERTRAELNVHTILGPALIAMKGYASPEVEQTYMRVQELSQHLEDSRQLFLAQRGLWNCYLMRTEVHTARTLGEQLFRLASHAQTPALLVEAQRALGTTLFFQGELVAARMHLEEGITLYDRQQHQTLVVHYGADPGVTCRVYAARTLWLLGFPDQALHRGHDALHHARDLGHPFSLGFALSFLTDLLLLRREGQAAHAQNEAVLTLVRDHGFPHWVAVSMLNRGWSLVEQGQWEAGITQISQGLDVWQATGAALEKPLNLAVLAEAYGKVGRAEEGLACVAEGLTLVEQTGERWWEAELHRLQGELALQQALPDILQGEACFHQALALARQQQARSLELRAATSLGRLWQHQGKRREARELLAPIYDWFSEGFDLADLMEAKALLEEVEG